jgi:hypothetical protein
MSQDITSDLSFFTLNKLDVGFHSILSERLCEFIVNVRVGM